MGGFEAKAEAIESDEAWVEQQLESTPGPNEGYTDDQFAKDVEKARAREAMKQSTAKPFPR